MALATDKARTFLLTHGRIVECRLYETLFEGAPPAAVRDALRAYRNADGGFGHGLEPDVRAPESQPIAMHIALSTMRDAGIVDPQIGDDMCAFLAVHAREDGAIPYLLETAKPHPRAGHWQGDFAFAASLNATAGLVSGLHAIQATHPWLDLATRWCLDVIASDPDYSGHTLLSALDVLTQAPGNHTRLWERAVARLFEADYVAMKTPLTGYGLTPVQFAPSPTARARGLFADDVIEAHLNDLAGRQQADGGWPLSWSPPEGAATNAWRARMTVTALTTLRAYGRL